MKPYGKNYLAVRFKLDYVTSTGENSNHITDFFMKLHDGFIVVAEPTGQEDVDVEPQIARLKSKFDDVISSEDAGRFRFVHAGQSSFEKFKPKRFSHFLKEYGRFGH